jgi:hypothetical protein
MLFFKEENFHNALFDPKIGCPKPLCMSLTSVRHGCLAGREASSRYTRFRTWAAGE